MSLGTHLTMKLNDGHFMPILGFGTSAATKVANSKVEEATERAIGAGYRHIDSAYIYQNEEEVGRALQKKMADGTVTRDDLFFTTKFGEELLPKDTQGRLIFDQVDLCATWEVSAASGVGAAWGGSGARPVLPPVQTLARPSRPSARGDPRLVYGHLCLSRLPLPAPHSVSRSQPPGSPHPTRDPSQLPPPQAMEHCKEAGLTRSIGVSNFNRRQLELIINKPGLRHKPVCNQVECHPYLNQSKLLNFCKSKDIVLVAFGALGFDIEKEWVMKNFPVLLRDPVIKAIADKHGRTPAQVALRYQLQRGLVVLAKSFNEKRMRENLQVHSRAVGSRGWQGPARPLGRAVASAMIRIIRFLMNINDSICGRSRCLFRLIIGEHREDEKVFGLLHAQLVAVRLESQDQEIKDSKPSLFPTK
ncbi:Aldo-keto reductase family 1 member C1 like protein [Pteropus alecto]|uniref:Aldo-keto reductase family 1 member C1 like protein n=1 Tax=Pteropus alecto TaxID=9402 RepID=L5KZK5_PTEAL|nr:Aldo-keto reductase family 1 member C1 like protein [Pteropus alecto]